MRTIHLIICAALCCVGGARADQASLDALVKKEQANVDNEAVVVYGGKVGKLEAIFFIEWSGTGNPIDGEYYYLSRGREKSYVLQGSNPKEGVLLLEEYTQDGNGVAKLTANCRLTKKVEKGRIVWAGMMNNTDGRALEMSFSRKK